MPRSATVSTPHPSPRFRDKIRLRQRRRGPTDLLWCATFCVDGRWLTAKPISLGTTDFNEACEVARDKYAAMNGQGVEAVLRTYTSPQPKVAHQLADYAERAIAKLEAQAQAADARAPGKGHNYRQIARRIRCDLVPRWGQADITKLTDDALNHWIEFHYRVEDRKATVALHGRQPRDASRQRVTVRPSQNTLGNLDQALLFVWQEAVADRIVGRRARPMIDRSLGEDSEPRAFVDEAGVLAIARVMTNEWVASNEGHSSDLKRLLRAYVAMLACTGIRPGLEAKRVRLSDVRFEEQDGKPVILISVMPRQGKHPKAREVIVFEGGLEFNVRRLLRELIDWRKSHGATDRDLLFSYPDGREPIFRDALDTVLKIADAEFDPLTNERRTSYSFRHFFAVRLIQRKHSVPFIAAWLGTSSQMVERNYNRFLIARQASRVNGGNPWVSMMSEIGRTDPTILAQLSQAMRRAR